MLPHWACFVSLSLTWYREVWVQYHQPLQRAPTEHPIVRPMDTTIIKGLLVPYRVPEHLAFLSPSSAPDRLDEATGAERCRTYTPIAKNEAHMRIRSEGAIISTTSFSLGEICLLWNCSCELFRGRILRCGSSGAWYYGFLVRNLVSFSMLASLTLQSGWAVVSSHLSIAIRVQQPMVLKDLQRSQFLYLVLW